MWTQKAVNKFAAEKGVISPELDKVRSGPTEAGEKPSRTQTFTTICHEFQVSRRQVVRANKSCTCNATYTQSHDCVSKAPAVWTPSNINRDCA